jgi:hypothetical protein
MDSRIDRVANSTQTGPTGGSTGVALSVRMRPTNVSCRTVRAASRAVAPAEAAPGTAATSLRTVYGN